jgi:hypothetical protein
LITTLTRVKRIPLLALLFVSATEFILERALIDLVLMSGALTILLWGGGWRPRHVHTLSKKRADAYVDDLRRDSRTRSNVNALKPKWVLTTGGGGSIW